MKFFKAIVYGHSIPLDADEIEKVAGAIASGQQGLLILKQGVIDLRSPVHIAPDNEREKRHHSPYEEERKEIQSSTDLFADLRKNLVGQMQVGAGQKSLEGKK